MNTTRKPGVPVDNWEGKQAKELLFFARSLFLRLSRVVYFFLLLVSLKGPLMSHTVYKLWRLQD